jgi:acetyltransferase
MVELRPLGPGDRAAYEAFVGGLSPESRLQRFLAPVRELHPGVLAALTSADQERHVALGAFQGDTLVGEARFVRLGEDGRAEFALAVADAWQRKGIGALLLDALLAAARRARLAVLEGEVLRTNLPMLEFVRSAGFRLRTCPGDATLAIAERSLA